MRSAFFAAALVAAPVVAPAVAAAVLVLACVSPAQASGPEHVLKSVLENGRSAASAVNLITFTRAGVAFAPRVGDRLKDGTRVSTPAGITVVIARTDGKAEIRVNPGASVTLIATGSDGEESTLDGTGGSFSIVPGVLDFFRVTFRRFVASAKGTQFSIDASSDAVAFRCARGSIDVVRRGSILIRSSGTEVALVSQVDRLSAGGTGSKTYPITEERYLQTFGTLTGAADYYRAQLRVAQAGHDDVGVEASLDALARLFDDLGEPSTSLTFAERRLAFVADRPRLPRSDLADAYWRLSYALNDAQAYTRALLAAETSVRLYARIDPQHRLENNGWAYNALGLALRSVGRYDPAYDAFAVELQTFARTERPPSSGAFVADENLGGLVSAFADYAGQLRYLLAASAIATRGPLSPRVARLYVNLCRAYLGVGDAGKALSYGKRGRQMWRRLYGDDRRANVADALECIAVATALRRDSATSTEGPNALSIAKAALSIVQSIARPTVAARVAAHVTLGVVYREDSDAMDSAHEYGQAGAIEMSAPGSDPIARIDGYYHLVRGATIAGDGPEAVAAARAEIAIARTLPDAPIVLADAYDDLAAAYRAAHDWQGAFSALNDMQRALAASNHGEFLNERARREVREIRIRQSR